MTHIGMIHLTRQRFPPDIRIEKEARALTNAGFKVCILCRRVDGDLPCETLDSGATVFRETPDTNRKLLPTRSGKNPEWGAAMSRFIERADPDVLHVHDLPLVEAALDHGERYGKPVVADLHENWPAAMRAWRVGKPWWHRLRAAIRRPDYLLRRAEMRSARCCARLIVVVPEAASRFVRAGIPQERIVVVSNTEDDSTMPTPLPPPSPRVESMVAGRWTLCYIGGIGPHRGLDTAIRALPAIAEHVPNVLLIVVGVKRSQRQIVNRIAGRARAEHLIRVEDWAPFSTCLEIMQAADVCLVPHNDFEHTQTTVPHKLFQYMYCGRPVIVSDCRPLKRIVQHTGAGVVFRANDTTDFADRKSVV